MKLILPISEMTKQMELPGVFLRFLGVAEILGGLGLILPGALRIKTFLTPLAAACLLPILFGAVVTTLMTSPPAMALLPLVTAMLTGFVGYGRWKLLPLK